MLRCVIFDMDGVIVNSEPIHIASEKVLFRSLGIQIDDDEHFSFVGTTSVNMWQQLKYKYGLKGTIPALIALERRAYWDYLKKVENLKPIPYIKKLIRQLSKMKIKLIVASSSPLNQIEYILAKLELKKYFTLCLSGDQVRRGKPEPDIFLEACKLGKVRPQECVVIEDSQNGVIAARKAGIKCVALQNPGSGKQNLSRANLVVKSIGRISYSLLRQLLNG